MKRKWIVGGALVVIAALSLALVFWRPSRQFSTTRTYRIGYGDDMPLHFRGADGVATGIGPEVVKAAAARRGIRLQWIEAEHPGIESIRRGEVDFWVLLSDLPERHSLVHFTQPYLSTERCYVVLTDSHIASIRDLSHARIGYRDAAQNAPGNIKGPPPAPNSDIVYLRKTLPNAQPLFVAYHNSDPWKDLFSHRIDALLLNKNVATALLLAGGSRGELAMLPATGSAVQMGLASSFETAAAADAIRDEVRAMSEEGALADIVQRWGFLQNGNLNVVRELSAAKRTAYLLAAALLLLLALLSVISAQTLRLRRQRNLLVETQGALRGSEAKFRAIVEHSHEGIMFTDASGMVIYRSPTNPLIDGYSDEERLGRVWFEVVDPEDLAAVQRTWSEVLAHPDRAHEVYYRIRHKSGSCKWVETTVQNLLDNSSVNAVVAAVHDITDRRVAEKELAEAIDQATETVFITDINGTITYANPAFEKTTGYKLEEVLGKNPRMLRSGKHDAAFYRQMWETLLRGEVWRGRLFNKRKDGTLYQEEATISPVRDDSGRIVNYIAVKLDVTREAELQAQLLQAQKMESIGRLAGGVAHDFNNLLTVINGYSKLVLNGLTGGDPMRDKLEEIRKAGERAAALTRQLLAFSRKQILEPRVLDLNRVVQEMQAMLRRLMGEHIQVDLVLCTDDATVQADPHQLEQVIMNLAVNGRDAMPGGGRLLIETALVQHRKTEGQEHRSGPFAMLAVSDTGMGIDEAMRQRIFEPFFTTKPVGQGTGLGLSTVQGIVEQSGGFIEVRSHPGQGTTFQIYLPALTAARVNEKIAVESRALPGSETVLVVEDQAEVRDFVVTVLGSYGYKVVGASNAGEALLICEREGEHIHLLLTDVVMPQTSGPELVSRLAKTHPGIKTLFMSGYTDDMITNHGVLDEGSHFIQKPFTAEKLAEKVRQVLTPVSDPRA